MHNSLAKRLTYRIMAVVLVMIAVITGIVYLSVREYMQEEAQERYLGILLKTHEETRRRLSDVYVATINNVDYIEHDLDDPEKAADVNEDGKVDVSDYIGIANIILTGSVYGNGN